MYIVIITIDSWHLANGIHQPSLDTYISDNLDVCLDKAFSRWDDLKDNKGNLIDKDYIHSKLGDKEYLNVEVIRPREGWIRIEYAGE